MIEEENKSQKEVIKQKIKEMEEVVRVFLDADAIERLNNIKIAHQEKYLEALTVLYQLITSGQIEHKITGEQLKLILSKLFEKNKRKTRIRIIRR